MPKFAKFLLTYLLSSLLTLVVSNLVASYQLTQMLQQLAANLSEIGTLSFSTAKVNCWGPKIEIQGLSFQTKDAQEPLQIGHLRVDDIGFEALLEMIQSQQKFPNRFRLSLKDARIPRQYFPERAMELLKLMDLPVVMGKASLSVRLHPQSNEVELNPLLLDVEDAFQLELKARASGLSLPNQEEAAPPGLHPPEARLFSASLHYLDEGLIPRLRYNIYQNEKRDLLRETQQLATDANRKPTSALDPILQTPRVKARALEGLSAFLQKPENLQLEVESKSGIAVEEFLQKVKSDPDQLASELGLQMKFNKKSY